MLASVGKAEEEAREVLEAVLRSLGFASVVLEPLPVTWHPMPDSFLFPGPRCTGSLAKTLIFVNRDDNKKRNPGPAGTAGHTGSSLSLSSQG